MPLRIAIIGRGRFGQALIKLFGQYAPEVEIVTMDRAGDQLERPEMLANCRAVILAVPIQAFAKVVEEISPRIATGTLVIDVCSVKEYPVRIMESLLPLSVNILATHPMFGPESLEAASWKLGGLNLVLCAVRIEPETYAGVRSFLDQTGLVVREMQPAEHDRTMARTQFVSMLTGLWLDQLGLQASEIDTPSFRDLLKVRDTVKSDSTILEAMYRYVPACREQAAAMQSQLNQLIFQLPDSDKEF